MFKKNAIKYFHGFYLGHNQNFKDTIWIVGPLEQAIISAMICQIKKKKDNEEFKTKLVPKHNFSFFLVKTS